MMKLVMQANGPQISGRIRWLSLRTY